MRPYHGCFASRSAWSATLIRRGVALMSLCMGVLFAIGGSGCTSLQSPPPDERPYLDFVRNTVDRHILSNQTARLGGQPDGTLFVTLSRKPERAWTSLGMWDRDHYQLYPIPEVRIERAPVNADLDAWPLLDRLSRLTGDPRYARLTDAMAAAFGRWGFDPASGLLLAGNQSLFDVVARKPVGPRSANETPEFKPVAFPIWDRLWAVAPDAMLRFSHAAYYGLVTRPATMDYNRFCEYGFDDWQRRHVTPFNPQHRGFVYSGAMLIHYWLMAYTRAGDTQCLAWAQAMAAKWAALQHPQSGLLPHFVGAVQTDDPAQSPAPYANVLDVQSAVLFLEAADMLTNHPEMRALATQLDTLGRRSLLGLCRTAYDTNHRLWVDWIALDGSPYTGDPQYGFRSEAEKAEALKRDPRVAAVGVYPGIGAYASQAFLLQAFGGPPDCVMRGAALTRDPELLALARRVALLVRKEARARTDARNALGQWGFPATGQYVNGLLDLYAATGDGWYRERARELADIELRLLALAPDTSATPDTDPGATDWWRLMTRSRFLNALLRLEEAERPF